MLWHLISEVNPMTFGALARMQGCTRETKFSRQTAPSTPNPAPEGSHGEKGARANQWKLEILS